MRPEMQTRVYDTRDDHLGLQIAKSRIGESAALQAVVHLGRRGGVDNVADTANHYIRNETRGCVERALNAPLYLPDGEDIRY